MCPSFAGGTPPYMPPEWHTKMLSPGHSAQLDTWSMGVILFQMATGHLPFGNDGQLNLDLLEQGKDHPTHPRFWSGEWKFRNTQTGKVGKGDIKHHLKSWYAASEPSSSGSSAASAMTAATAAKGAASGPEGKACVDLLSCMLAADVTTNGVPQTPANANGAGEAEDLIDLLCHIFQPDAARRYKPKQALAHRFWDHLRAGETAGRLWLAVEAWALDPLRPPAEGTLLKAILDHSGATPVCYTTLDCGGSANCECILRVLRHANRQLAPAP